MKNKLLHFLEDMSSQARNAFWSIIVLLVASGLNSIVTFRQASTSGTWQAWAEFSVVALFFVALLISAFLNLRGRTHQAIGLMFGSFLFTIIARNALTEDLGVFYGLIVIAVTSVLAYFNLPRKTANRLIIASIVIGGLIVLFDLVVPSYRQPAPPVLLKSLPVVASLVFLILLFLMIRQAWGGSLRTKLLVSFIGIVVLTTGVLSAFVIYTTTNNLRGNLGRELTSLAENRATGLGNLLNEQINNLTAFSQGEVLQGRVREQNRSYPDDAAATQADIDTKDAQWRAADAANNNSDFLVRERLSNAAARDLLEYQKAFPDNTEIFITDVNGGLAAATNRTSDYNQADEAWWQAAYNNGQGAVYISDPEFDVSSNTFGILLAMPLRERTSGKIVGILRTTYVLSPLAAILQQEIGQTGSADIYIPGDTVSRIHEGALETVDRQVLENLQSVAGQGMTEMDYEGALSVVSQAVVQSRDENQAIKNLGWIVAFHQNQAEAFAPLNAQIRGIIIVMMVVIFLAVLAAIFVAQSLVRPLTQLTNTAQEITAGNLNSQAQVTSSDEIGLLASTFNTMTSRLRELVGSLEQRVTDRTKDLATVAFISTNIATIRDPFQMLATTVHLTQRRFNLYHAHVFTYHKDSGELQIAACGYKEGDEHEGTHGTAIIPFTQEQSLVARAARTRKPVIVNDVRSDPGWLPNPLLPDTHAEMAVPMIAGDELLGVLDVQADHVDAFTEQDANIQMTLASQIATSYQSALAFEQSKSQADLESLVNAIGQKIQRATTVEDTLQTAIREVGLALGAARVSANIGTSRQHDGDISSRN